MDLITSDSSYLRESSTAGARGRLTALGSSALDSNARTNQPSFTSYSNDFHFTQHDSNAAGFTSSTQTAPTMSSSWRSAAAAIYDKYDLSSSDRYHSTALPATTATTATTSSAFTSNHLDHLNSQPAGLFTPSSRSLLDKGTDSSTLYRPMTSSSALEPTTSSYDRLLLDSSNSPLYKPTTKATGVLPTRDYLGATQSGGAGAHSSATAITDKYTPSYQSRDLNASSTRFYDLDNTNAANGLSSRSLGDLPTKTNSMNLSANRLASSAVSANAIDTSAHLTGGAGATANNRNNITNNNNFTSSIGATGNSAALTGSRAQSGLGAATAGGHNILRQLFDDMRQIEDTVDSIEIPARGRCKVFMAKYGYDPYKQSPNENLDNELAFNAGDYIMVFDDVDEDGYFVGELMDGRRGYVPSNWLDRLTGEDLFDFQANTLYIRQNHGTAKTGQDDEACPSESNSYPPEFYDALLTDTLQHSNFQHLLAPEDYRRMNDYVDLDDVDEVDDECLSDYERAEAEQMRRAVPPPQKLLLERQLNKSILISWLHPEAPKGTIISYQVYVDGVLKSTVPSGDRTKALLEGVDSTIPHRISVRAIDLKGRHSNDAGCTIVIGQCAPFAPSCVKASHITSDSALISWLPCNSNFHHVVAVNSVEVQTVRPGVYKHLINGLSANTLYRVWVRAKPGKILSVDEKNPKKLESLTTYVDFKTMPKSLPDPPVNVQVEAGPQRRTLLVTWLPLTLNNFGSSNGCPVTGYAVFAGHKKLADIDSPTGDHALLDLTDLESLHKKSVTVRTKSGENLSQDSMSCTIPDEYLKNASRSLNDGSHLTGASSHHHHHHQSHSQSMSARANPNPDPHSRFLQDSSTHQGRNSPSSFGRNRYSATDNRLASASHFASPRAHSSQYRSASMARGRQMTRSLQNLETDLESGRSSIPAIEISRGGEAAARAGGDYVFTESYSEEEFENSMRFRGVRDKSGNRVNPRYRPRRYYSIDNAGPGRGQSLPRSRGGGVIERDVRYFVALFDYDPSTMSPNPNAASEELAFKEGSIIKVIGEKGPDGFYRGELDNHVGFVPCNVVSEITDPNVLHSLHEKSNLKRQQHMPAHQANLQLGPQNFISGPQQVQQQGQTTLQQQIVNQQRSQQIPANQSEFELQQQQQQQQQQTQQQQLQQNVSGVKRMVALYDYNPQESSPNVDTESEVPFKVGDIIYVYGKIDPDGFYIGEVERTKQKGLVPSNFLQEDPLPVNVKGPMTLQQQLSSQANNVNPLLDPMQQQRAQNQFGSAAPMQQSIMIDSTMAFNQQQQQGMGNMINNPQIRGSIRGMNPPQTQQNINRPTSLSLGSGNFNQQMGHNQNDWTQRPQLQGINQPQEMQSNQQQQQQQMLNSQQQQQLSGMLSNLLSSGKQIINAAAATPRMPGQVGQFPLANQAGNMGNQMMGGQANMGNTNMAQANMGMSGGGGSGTGMGMTMGMGHGDLSGANMMDTTGTTAGGGGVRPGMMQGGNLMQSSMQQSQQQHQPMQQQHQFNQQMGFNRGPMNQPGGEDQGGNILNTVKNMFKL